MKTYYVYMTANWTGDVIYIGMTNDIVRRIAEHKQKLVSGFTKQYCADKLVYLEAMDDVNDAIAREKQLKNWRREKKIILIEQQNPNWEDLSEV